MRHLNWLDWTVLSLMLVGGLNWGLVGFFDLNLVSEIFGVFLGRVIFALVGISALYSIYILGKVNAGTAEIIEEPEELHRAA